MKVIFRILIFLLLIYSCQSLISSPVTLINDGTRRIYILDEYNGNAVTIAPQEMKTIDAHPKDFLAQIPHRAGIKKERLVFYIETKPGSNRYTRRLRLTQKYNIDNDRKSRYKLSEIMRENPSNRIKERFHIKYYHRMKKVKGPQSVIRPFFQKESPATHNKKIIVQK